MTKKYLHANKKHFVKSIYSVEKSSKNTITQKKKFGEIDCNLCLTDTHNPLVLYISRNCVIMVLTLATFPFCVVYWPKYQTDFT